MLQKKIIKVASLMMFITLISKFIGMFRDSLIAKAFGSGYEMDAYNIALTIPNIIFDVIGTALLTTLIPLLSETLHKKDKESMFSFANNIINITLILAVVLGGLGYLFSPYIVKIIAPSFVGKTYELTINLVKITMVNCLFMSITIGYQSILQVLNKFIAPAFYGIVLSFPIIVYLPTNSIYGIYGLTVATVIGYVLQVLILMIVLKRSKYKYKLYINIFDIRLKKMAKSLLPVILSISVNQVNVIVDRIMTSSLPEGSISSLAYASRINSMVYSIFATTVITLLYPKLSKEGISNNLDRFKSSISQAVNSLNIVMIPSIIVIIILNRQIVSTIYKHGNFDDKAVYMTSIALICYLIGTLALGIQEIFYMAFYSIQDTITPMKNGIIGVTFNVIFNIIFVKMFGIAGSALATSLSTIICCSMLIFKLNKKIGNMNIKASMLYSLKLLISALVMALVIFVVNRIIGNNTDILTNIESIAICTISGMIIYSMMLYILGVEEFNRIIKMAYSKIKNS